MPIDQIDWDTKMMEIKHLDWAEFQNVIQQNRLSVAMVQVWDIQVCEETAEYIGQYSDRINFIAVDYHDIPDKLKKDNSDSPTSFVASPFIILFYAGRAMNIMKSSEISQYAIFWSILENKKLFDTILPINHTLSSKR